MIVTERKEKEERIFSVQYDYLILDEEVAEYRARYEREQAVVGVRATKVGWEALEDKLWAPPPPPSATKIANQTLDARRKTLARKKAKAKRRAK